MQPETWTVVDDWPDIVPVGGAEIEVLETYLSDLLDDLLNPSPGGAVEHPQQKKG